MTDLIEHLPCDVLVQPATLIERGCKITTLLECIEMRRERAEKGPPLPDILSRRQADQLSALRERVEALEAELQAKKDADLDRHIFAWFNDFDCDEMRRCLETYDARAILAQHGGEVG